MAGTGGHDGDGTGDVPPDHRTSGSSRADDDELGLDLDRLPRWAAGHSMRIASGDTIDYRAEDWQDSMLIVMEGAIELESRLGSVHRFDSGSILWCQGLPIRLIRSAGLDAAVLLSISRRSRPP